MIGESPVVAFADLIGLIGATLLAIPFFMGQRPRDTVLLALARGVRVGAFDTTIQRRVAHIAAYWNIEMNCARVGVSLIAVAFLMRVLVAIADLHRAGYF
jgi:hypothetical protein